MSQQKMQVAHRLFFVVVIWTFVICSFALVRLIAQRPSLSIELWVVLVAVGFQAAGFATRNSNSASQAIGLCAGTAILTLVGIAAEIHSSGFPPPMLVKVVAMAAYLGSVALLLWVPLRTRMTGDSYQRLYREMLFTAALIAIPISGTLFAGERDFLATLPALTAQTFVALVGITCFVYAVARFRALSRRALWASFGVAVLTLAFGFVIRTPWYFALCSSLAILGVGGAATIAISAAKGQVEASPLVA